MTGDSSSSLAGGELAYRQAGIEVGWEKIIINKLPLPPLEKRGMCERTVRRLPLSQRRKPYKTKTPARRRGLLE